MKTKDVYLTFKTDAITAELLKIMAHAMNKTQPELINEICKDFIKAIDEEAKRRLQEEGHTIGQ